MQTSGYRDSTPAEIFTMTIDLPVSSIFDDRYEIIEQIGEGGMGRVYKVKEIELNRLVALKLLHPSLVQDC